MYNPKYTLQQSNINEDADLYLVPGMSYRSVRERGTRDMIYGGNEIICSSSILKSRKQHSIGWAINIELRLHLAELNDWNYLFSFFHAKASQ